MDDWCEARTPGTKYALTGRDCPNGQTYRFARFHDGFFKCFAQRSDAEAAECVDKEGNSMSCRSGNVNEAMCTAPYGEFKNMKDACIGNLIFFVSVHSQ